MAFKSFIHTLRYIKHNKKLFKQPDLKKGIVLIEIFDHKPSVIPNSYMINLLSKKFEIMPPPIIILSTLLIKFFNMPDLSSILAPPRISTDLVFFEFCLS